MIKAEIPMDRKMGFAVLEGVRNCVPEWGEY